MVKVTLASPDMNGLILSGGKSARMGFDKSLIKYHNVPQHEHIFNLISPFCEDVYFSCNKSQKHLIDNYPTIIDKLAYQGPMHAIIRAFEMKNTNWLILPIDMPTILTSHIERLIQNVKGHDVVCFESDESVNPLFAIYSSSCVSRLKNFQGDSPLKFIKTLSAKILTSDMSELRNINTKQEFEKFKNHG